MSERISDCPPLFAPGEHSLCVELIQLLCVDYFPLSSTRRKIMQGFLRIYSQALRLEIPGDLVVDGSFITEEIDPDDIDFALVISPEFYDGCNAEQRKFIEWIRDDKFIAVTHLCDCYLCVEWPVGHEQYFEGLQNREYWIKWYSKSKLYKRDRGIVIVSLENEGEL